MSPLDALRQHRAVFELARLVCFAVKVDVALLRRMRMRFLPEHGADIDARDAQGFTQIYGVHAFLANKVRDLQGQTS